MTGPSLSLENPPSAPQPQLGSFPSMQETQEIYDGAKRTLLREKEALTTDSGFLTKRLINQAEVAAWVQLGSLPPAGEVSADIEFCTLIGQETFYRLVTKNAMGAQAPTGQLRRSFLMTGHVPVRPALPPGPSVRLDPETRRPQGPPVELPLPEPRVLNIRIDQVLGALSAEHRVIEWSFPVSTGPSEPPRLLSDVRKRAYEQMMERLEGLSPRAPERNLPAPGRIAQVIFDRLLQLFVPSWQGRPMCWVPLLGVRAKTTSSGLEIQLLKLGASEKYPSIRPMMVSFDRPTANLGLMGPPAVVTEISWRKRHAKEVELLTWNRDPQGQANVAWMLAWEIYDRLCSAWSSALTEEAQGLDGNLSFEQLRKHAYRQVLGKVSEGPLRRETLSRQIESTLIERLNAKRERLLKAEGKPLNAVFQVWLMGDYSIAWKLLFTLSRVPGPKYMVRPSGVPSSEELLNLNGWVPNQKGQAATSEELLEFSGRWETLRLPDRYQDALKVIGPEQAAVMLVERVIEEINGGKLVDAVIGLLLKRVAKRLISGEIPNA